MKRCTRADRTTDAIPFMWTAFYCTPCPLGPPPRDSVEADIGSFISDMDLLNAFFV
jgi:hypothetical protein